MDDLGYFWHKHYIKVYKKLQKRKVSERKRVIEVYLEPILERKLDEFLLSTFDDVEVLL